VIKRCVLNLCHKGLCVRQLYTKHSQSVCSHNALNKLRKRRPQVCLARALIPAMPPAFHRGRPAHSPALKTVTHTSICIKYKHAFALTHSSTLSGHSRPRVVADDATRESGFCLCVCVQGRCFCFCAAAFKQIRSFLLLLTSIGRFIVACVIIFG
jgi:hypothetical protein